MKINKTYKYRRYEGKLNTKKKAVISIVIVGSTVITMNIFGIFNYLEAKSVDLVSLKDEIMYEDISSLDVIEVDNIDKGANDLYLVQVHLGISKIKYYDVETKEKLFEIDKKGVFSYDTHYEELNGKILNIESFYKYIDAVDTLKSSYTNSEFMEIWEKTKEHYENMKRVDRIEEKKKEYYKYGYIFY